MKTIKNILFITILFFSASAAAQQISTAELQVDGLTCSMCSRATETALRSLDFVEDVTPDLNKNLFILKFKKGDVNPELLKKKVEDAGFSVGTLSAILNFKQTTLDAEGKANVSGFTYQFTNGKSKVLDGPVKATLVNAKNMNVYQLSI